MDNKIRVILVDDHPVFVMGLESLLKLEDDMEITGKTINGTGALRIMESKDVDIVVMDISMPELNGLDTAEIIKETYPEVKVVLVTVYDNADYISKAEKIGVEGYILKEEAPDVIVRVLRNVKNGFTDYRLSGNMFQVQQPLRILNLTERETEVVKLVAQGKTSKEISEELDISIRTAERHRWNFRKKLKVRTSMDIYKLAAKYNLIDTNIPHF